MPTGTQPVVLSIAGSDSGGGAGIQADLQAITDMGGFGTTAITAITAQNTAGVRRVDPVPVDGVVAQVQAVFDDMDVAAVKIGMLATAPLVRAVHGVLSDHAAGVPVVLDPVMVATSGDRLLDADAVAALRELAALATVVTPNLPEAAILAGTTEDALLADDAGLLAWAGSVPHATLVTGGDAPTGAVIDRLVVDGVMTRRWAKDRIAGGPFHGTGCTLSSAVATLLAHGLPLDAAVIRGITYVRGRLKEAWRPGKGSAVLGRP